MCGSAAAASGRAEEDADKVAAYLTLYECLVTVTKLLAPLTPFLAESLYQNLVRSVDASAPESVHLCDWPVADRITDLAAAARRDGAGAAAGGAGPRGAREGADPRAAAAEPALRPRRRGGRARDEWRGWPIRCSSSLNVKRLEVLPPQSDMLHYTVQPRMAVLGPKHGRLLPKVLARAALRRHAGEGAHAARNGTLPLEVEGQTVELTPEEVEVEASAREGFVAAEDRGYVVLLDTQLTAELVAEGLVRDLTHLIQEVRKRAGLAIEDSIETWLHDGRRARGGSGARTELYRR